MAASAIPGAVRWGVDGRIESGSREGGGEEQEGRWALHRARVAPRWLARWWERWRGIEIRGVDDVGDNHADNAIILSRKEKERSATSSGSQGGTCTDATPLHDGEGHVKSGNALRALRTLGTTTVAMDARNNAAVVWQTGGSFGGAKSAKCDRCPTTSVTYETGHRRAAASGAGGYRQRGYVRGGTRWFGAAARGFVEVQVACVWRGADSCDQVAHARREERGKRDRGTNGAAVVQSAFGTRKQLPVTHPLSRSVVGHQEKQLFASRGF